MNFINRPLTPHLTIYKPQLSSITSILHRITGLSLALSLIMFIIIVKLSNSLVGFYLLTFIVFSYKHIYISLFILLNYHIYNGLRNILINFNYTISIIYLKSLFKIYLILFFIYLIKISVN